LAKVKDAGITPVQLAEMSMGADTLTNYSVVCSVGSSALTIALKTRAGTGDPSSTDYCTIAFRSTTATTGVYSRVNVTAATSLVISSGSTLGHVSAAEWPIYVYAINNAGTVELAASTSPKDERYVVSSTTEGGAGASDSPATLYSTTARSNVACRLIAVLKSTQTTAGTWAAVPTHVSSNEPHPLANVAIRPSHTTVGVGGVALSASCSSYSVAAGSTPADITNLSVTISTSGRPVKVMLVPDGSVNNSYYGANASGSGDIGSLILLYRDATVIGRFLNEYDSVNGESNAKYLPVSTIQTVDPVAAGTYTYKAVASNVASVTQYVSYAKLLAYEI
jgi:hypothetical protein